MIVFELYRQLDVRMYMTASAIDRTYGSIAKYILSGDSLILLGVDHSLEFKLINKEVVSQQPVRNWDIDSEPVLWFAENSTESIVIRMINLAFRQWLNIDPFDTIEEFYQAVYETNERLANYNIRMMIDAESLCVFYDDEPVTLEQAIEKIMEIDAEANAAKNIPMWQEEARLLKGQDRFEEASERYEKILVHIDRSQELYTECAYALAECYYYIGNYERSVKLFYRCNLEFIEDEDLFYSHVGHALLDAKMKKYERQIKIYYRGRIDPVYSDTHRQAITAAGNEVGEVFAEYEETCLNMGRKKYAEFRNHLPVDADDIDELVAVDSEKEQKEQEEILKRYENIKLIEPIFQKQPSSKSINEMLSRALDLFVDGEYQEAFDIYFRLKQDVQEVSDYYTWIQFQIGKLYCIFDDMQKAFEALSKCKPEQFGLIYRVEDFLVLYEHVRIVCDDFESDVRYRKLIRGKYDFYYAQYDKEYQQLLKDRKLQRAFEEYEAECMESAKRELAQALENVILPEGRDEKKKKPKLFQNLFKHKRKDKQDSIDKIDR